MISQQIASDQPRARLRALNPTIDYSGTISFKIDFSFSDEFINSITLETLRQAYKQSDRRIRIKYKIRLYKKTTIGSKKLRGSSFSKKWTLYWTRDPSILEKYATNIWALGVDKDGYAEFFGDFDEAKKFLFTFSEMITIAANEVGAGESVIGAVVEARIWRHTFTNPKKISTKAEPVKVSVLKD